MRTSGDVGNWLVHFPWCMFHLHDQYHSKLHPFPSIAQATTVHALGVALLEAMYDCLLPPYRRVGERLESLSGDWPQWFKAQQNTMSVNQRQAVLLLSCPAVVQYPPPRAHGVSHADNTHHDCCLRLQPKRKRRWVLVHTAHQVPMQYSDVAPA